MFNYCADPFLLIIFSEVYKLKLIYLILDFEFHLLFKIKSSFLAFGGVRLIFLVHDFQNPEQATTASNIANSQRCCNYLS